MSDTISKQSVIDEIDEIIGCHYEHEKIILLFYNIKNGQFDIPSNQGEAERLQEAVHKKGVLNQSRKQADFIRRLGSVSGENHTKRFIAACNAEMLVPFIQITKCNDKLREIEYEITIPGITDGGEQ
ncbi:hypothetical protein [Cohnella yongneupensis]|uniref:Uncharacterized protein n=1 Tax=Cohnella yongneupensis TaxID=425006 RepID=A0ABW0QVC7_9BACL